MHGEKDISNSIVSEYSEYRLFWILRWLFRHNIIGRSCHTIVHIQIQLFYLPLGSYRLNISAINFYFLIHFFLKILSWKKKYFLLCCYRFLFLFFVWKVSLTILELYQFITHIHLEGWFFFQHRSSQSFNHDNHDNRDNEIIRYDNILFQFILIFLRDKFTICPVICEAVEEILDDFWQKKILSLVIQKRENFETLRSEKKGAKEGYLGRLTFSHVTRSKTRGKFFCSTSLRFHNNAYLPAAVF